MTAAVEVEHLTKRYGALTVVDDVSFAIEQGEFIGLLGPNGAGKSTTIHMLLGLISPDRGSIRILRRDLRVDRQQILGKVNFTAPYVAFPVRLTTFENLMVFAQLYGVPRPAEKIMDLLVLFGIQDLRNKPVGRLSSGENTRVGLCKALLNDPELLLLDEPTAYLDPQVSAVVTANLTALSRAGTTIIYTSHNMREVEMLCNRVIFLSHGKVLADGPPLRVTRNVLRDNRNDAALGEVFLRLAGRSGH
jgi:ABC-2 type transport system ATP-binding protein